MHGLREIPFNSYTHIQWELIRINIFKRRGTIEGKKGEEQERERERNIFFFPEERATRPFQRHPLQLATATFDTDKLKLLARLAAHYWLVSKISRLRVGPPTSRLVLTTFFSSFFPFFPFPRGSLVTALRFSNHCTTVRNGEKEEREKEREGNQRIGKL